MLYNVAAELDTTTPIDADTIDRYYDALDGYHASFSTGAHGRTRVLVTLPADTLDLAIRTAIAVIEHGTGSRVVALEAMTSDDFDRRDGLPTLPELVGGPEAADILGISRQAVKVMIDSGKFATATRIGERGVAIARAEVERMAEQRRYHAGDAIAGLAARGRHEN